MIWGKVIPVQAMKADTERTGPAPLIHNLSTRCRWWSTSRPGRFIPLGKNTW